jgi:hypothetical protein
VDFEHTRVQRQPHPPPEVSSAPQQLDFSDGAQHDSSLGGQQEAADSAGSDALSLFCTADADTPGAYGRAIGTRVVLSAGKGCCDPVCIINSGFRGDEPGQGAGLRSASVQRDGAGRKRTQTPPRRAPHDKHREDRQGEGSIQPGGGERDRRPAGHQRPKGGAEVTPRGQVAMIAEDTAGTVPRTGGGYGQSR